MENYPQETLLLDNFYLLAFDFLKIPPVDVYLYPYVSIIKFKLISHAILAQLVEQLFRKQKVKGSMPLIGFFGERISIEIFRSFL